MEVSIKSFFLFGSIILTGLSAGFFYAWAVSVIPGTLKIADSTYLETMQSINRAILNPAFYLIFFGPIIFLIVSGIYEYPVNKTSFVLLLISFIAYLIGTFGVTAFGNVPLNDQLDILKLAELNIDQLTEFREYYEERWNRLHLIRTIFSVLSFLFSVLGLIATSNHS